MKNLFTILIFLGFGLNINAQNYASFDELKNNIISKTIPLITVKELKKVENTKKPLLILDARERPEYNASHLKNAKYVGYESFKISALKGVDKNMTIVVYCSVGYRSERIGEKIKKAGYTKVLNLQGGIFDWVNNGFPVFDNTGNLTTKIHAYDKDWGRWVSQGDKVYE